jgi:hypothetical protein
MYFFFKNKCIKIEKGNDNLQEVPYSELKGYIWKNQIIDHEITLLPADDASDTSNCLFGQFLEKVCSPQNIDFPDDRSKREPDRSRLKAIISSIGYLLHTYKDSTDSKAIVYCEEKIAKGNEMNGRTGKSITGMAISHLRKRTFYDMKKERLDDKFLFQKVNLETQFLQFDDAKKNFDFESIFCIITEGMTVERKGQKPIDIPREHSPKVLITTNNVLSNDTASHRARKFEVEYSDFFSDEWTPVNEFGKKFFAEGWEKDDPEWDRFYNFMMFCGFFYLSNGLTTYEQVNLAERKINDRIPEEFRDLADDQIGKLNNDEKIYKGELYDMFVTANKIYGPSGKRACTAVSTTRWFKEYMDFKGIQIKDDRDKQGERKKYWTIENQEKNP